MRGPRPPSPGNPPKVVSVVIRGRLVSCAASDSEQRARRAQHFGCARGAERTSGEDALAGPDREEAPRAPCFFTSLPSSGGTCAWAGGRRPGPGGHRLDGRGREHKACWVEEFCGQAQSLQKGAKLKVTLQLGNTDSSHDSVPLSQQNDFCPKTEKLLSPSDPRRFPGTPSFPSLL